MYERQQEFRPLIDNLFNKVFAQADEKSHDFFRQMIVENCGYEIDEVEPWEVFRKLGQVNLITLSQHKE